MSVKSPGLGAGGLATLIASGGYAEGTFTPTLIGGTIPGTPTYTVQQGNYTRIGNRCFYNLVLAWSGTDGTGDLQVGGLPFTSNATANTAAGQAIGFYNGTDLAQSYFARIGNSAVKILLHTHIATTGLANLQIVASGNLQISGSYLL